MTESPLEQVVPELADLFDTYGDEVTPDQLREAFEDAGLRIVPINEGSTYDG